MNENHNNSIILQVENLSTSFVLKNRTIQAVNGVSFSLQRGEVLGILGESGSGKTVLAKSILGLIDPPGKITDGKILFEEKDLVKEPEETLRQFRGKRISYLLQNPMASFNPMYTIHHHFHTAILAPRAKSRKEKRILAASLLEVTGFAETESILRSYPHQLSGGMLQRVAIAIAVANLPDILIADEPTTSLDAMLQNQALQLLKEINQKYGISICVITHNFFVLRAICDRVIVMHDGRVIESGALQEVDRSPSHPYTRMLHRSLSALETREESPELLLNVKSFCGPVTMTGCPYSENCVYADSVCRNVDPPKQEISTTHWVLCHKEDAWRARY